MLRISMMKKAKPLARPITSKRDYEGAAKAAEKLRAEAEPDSAAERRLQALIREMEIFDDMEEDTFDDDPTGGLYEGPGRRWSDDGAGSE